MKLNKMATSPTPAPQSQKSRVPKPKYEATKIFTLRDLKKEVGEVEEKKPGVGSKTNANTMTNFEANDFVNGSVDTFDFDELKNLTINVSKVPDKFVDIVDGSQPSKSKVKSNINANSKQTPVKGESGVVDEKDKKNQAQSIKDFEERNKHFEERRKAKQKRLDDEMKKVCSFKPKINKKSAIIDRQRNNSPNRKRQDDLYELNTILLERKEELKEIIEAERYEKYGAKEVMECTFKPKLNNNRSNIENSDLDIAERNVAWQQKKKEKLQRVAEQNKEKELVGCTFKPQINDD